MPFITRPAAAVATVLSLSAAPALASSTMTSPGAATARTPLTATIATETPLIRVRFRLGNSVDPALEPNAVSSSYAANIVRRVHADSAQLPAKLEWVLGADVQRRGDNTIAYGQHELVDHQPGRGRRAVDRGLAYLRLSNYFFARADSLLGVGHPQYTADPYQPHENGPVTPSMRLIAKAPKPTLAATIAMGTPLLTQTIPERILGTDVELNQDAASYYSVNVARLRVARAQQPAQREWVQGVRALGDGDEQLSQAIDGVETVPPHTATRLKIQSALATFDHADAQISHADALIGVHASGPAVKPPARIIYMY